VRVCTSPVRSHTDHIPNQIGDAGEESLAGVLAQNSALAYLHISCNEPLLLLVLLLLLLLRTTDVFLVARVCVCVCVCVCTCIVLTYHFLNTHIAEKQYY
jgi:hypothetical protein